MGTSNKQRRATNAQTARARAAQMRLEQQRAARRRRALVVGGSTVAVLAIVGVLIAIGVVQHNKPQSTNGLRQPLTSAETAAFTSVTPATFASVGTATKSLVSSGLPQTVTDTALTSAGHPDVLYIGAEFCPYCAAERWSLAVALSRFGTLSGLQTMHSSSDDTDPNTPTITFLDSSYSSKYLTFSPVEDEDINHNSLQNPTTVQAALWKKYTYACSSDGCGNGFPFIDFGGKSVITGPTYDPGILKGLTQSQITSDLNKPSSPVAQAIDGTANYMTAALCLETDNQPASVCTSNIQSLEKSLPVFHASSSTGSTS